MLVLDKNTLQIDRNHNKPIFVIEDSKLIVKTISENVVVATV